MVAYMLGSEMALLSRRLVEGLLRTGNIFSTTEMERVSEGQASVVG